MKIGSEFVYTADHADQSITIKALGEADFLIAGDLFLDGYSAVRKFNACSLKIETKESYSCAIDVHDGLEIARFSNVEDARKFSYLITNLSDCSVKKDEVTTPVSKPGNSPFSVLKRAMTTRFKATSSWVPKFLMCATVFFLALYFIPNLLPKTDSSASAKVQQQSTLGAGEQYASQSYPVGAENQAAAIQQMAMALGAMTDEEFQKSVAKTNAEQSIEGRKQLLQILAMREFGKKLIQSGANLPEMVKSGSIPSSLTSPATGVQQSPNPFVIKLSETGKGSPLYVFADPQCPACQHYEKQLKSQIGKRKISLVPVAILPGSEFIVDQILCSPDPKKAWLQYLDTKQLEQHSMDGCGALFGYQKNNQLFQAAKFTQTPTTIFGSMPDKAFVGSIDVDKEERVSLSKAKSQK